MSKLHLWLIKSDDSLNTFPTLSQPLQNLVGQKLQTNKYLYNTFLKNLQEPQTHYSVANFLASRWQAESAQEMVDKDYATNSIYLHHQYTQDRVLHLIMSLETTTEFENYALLNSLSPADFEKVVLHIFTTPAQALPCWHNLIEKLGQKDDNILAKLVIGSVTDLAVILDTKNPYFSLLPRLMYEPTLASENEQYLSIDEYLKIHYGTRYYLNLDYYPPSFWQQLQNLQDPTDLLTLIISNQSSSTIFPTDNPQHRIELNDEVLFVNHYQTKLLQLYPLMQEINQVFNLQTYFFAMSSHPKYDVASLFVVPQLPFDNQIVINTDLSNLACYPKWLYQSIIDNHFILDSSTKNHSKQVLLDRFDLQDSLDQDRLKLNIIDTQVTGETFVLLHLPSTNADQNTLPQLYYPQQLNPLSLTSQDHLTEWQFWQMIASFFTSSG